MQRTVIATITGSPIKTKVKVGSMDPDPGLSSFCLEKETQINIESIDPSHEGPYLARKMETQNNDLFHRGFISLFK